MKLGALVVDQVMHCTAFGDIIFGSILEVASPGSAVESVGLRCDGIEIDPRNIASVNAGWQVLAIKTARHAASCRSLGDLAAEAEMRDAA
jgi:hypothetical protein